MQKYCGKELLEALNKKKRLKDLNINLYNNKNNYNKPLLSRFLEKAINGTLPEEPTSYLFHY
jgi:hypothetical protein